MIAIPAETQFNTRSGLQGLDSVWHTEEMVGLHRDWLRLVARKQRAAQEYSDYKGGDYRVVGRLAVAMAAAQSAVRIAHRAMLHRFDQLSRGIGLLAKVAGLSVAAANIVRPEHQALQAAVLSDRPQPVTAESEVQADSGQFEANTDVPAQATVAKPAGFDRIFANLPPRRFANDWPRRRRGSSG